MNKFMKQTPIQAGQFSTERVIPDCVLHVLLVVGRADTGTREENHGGIQGYTFIQRVKTTGKTFYLQDPLYIRRRAVL